MYVLVSSQCCRNERCTEQTGWLQSAEMLTGYSCRWLSFSELLAIPSVVYTKYSLIRRDISLFYLSLPKTRENIQTKIKHGISGSQRQLLCWIRKLVNQAEWGKGGKAGNKKKIIFVHRNEFSKRCFSRAPGFPLPPLPLQAFRFTWLSRNYGTIVYSLKQVSSMPFP